MKRSPDCLATTHIVFAIATYLWARFSSETSCKFHGIPWNWSCQRNWRTPSSINFHWTARISQIGALQVPWNSMEYSFYWMEPFVSSILWVLNLDRIPWNLRFQILMKIVFNFAPWINFRKLISTLFCKSLSPTNALLSIFALYHMHFRHCSLRIKISFKISFQCSLNLFLWKCSM